MIKKLRTSDMIKRNMIKILYSPKYDKHPKSSKFWKVNWDKKYSQRFGKMKINFDAEYGR